MKSWDIIDCHEDMNVLQSTFLFKCKCFPGGIIQKFKAIFCVRGDQHIEGVEFFENFATVVQWSMIRLIMIMSLTIVLVIDQADFSA